MRCVVFCIQQDTKQQEQHILMGSQKSSIWTSKCLLNIRLGVRFPLLYRKSKDCSGVLLKALNTTDLGQCGLMKLARWIQLFR